EAIDAPMFHTEHFPESFYPRGARPRTLQLEDRFGPGVADELRRRGHIVEPQKPWSLGRLSAAGRGGDGMLYAAANPRGLQGYAPVRRPGDGSLPTPSSFPSGSVNGPGSPMSMMFSGPMTRVPPRLWAFCSAASTSGPAT